MRIGFIVEGDTDKLVVESLARRLLPDTVQFHTVRIGGKAALRTAYTSVLTLLAKGYDHVVVLFDADSASEEFVAEQKHQVEATMAEHGVADRTSVVPVVPVIEDWLLEGLPDNALTTIDAARGLAVPLGHSEKVDRAIRNAQLLDPALLQRRNASFAHFAQVLGSLGSAHAAAGA